MICTNVLCYFAILKKKKVNDDNAILQQPFSDLAKTLPSTLRAFVVQKTIENTQTLITFVAECVCFNEP